MTTHSRFMKNNKDAAHTPKELLAELKTLVAEAETMMGDSLSEHTADAISNLRDRFSAAHERFSEMYDNTKKKVVAGAKYTDSTIRENPYQSIAVALGIGVLLGLVVGRRGK
jgi:ElaB/YqjD/DUF883 family membrane-anchored ribosome-binding protein